MKIELYLVLGDKDGILFKDFLLKNNIRFHEKSIEEFKYPNLKRVSVLMVRYSHAIHVCDGYQEHFLKQLLEHIEKYKPKIE